MQSTSNNNQRPCDASFGSKQKIEKTLYVQWKRKNSYCPSTSSFKSSSESLVSKIIKKIQEKRNLQITDIQNRRKKIMSLNLFGNLNSVVNKYIGVRYIKNEALFICKNFHVSISDISNNLIFFAGLWTELSKMRGLALRIFQIIHIFLGI